jgi:hypothetical protein
MSRFIEGIVFKELMSQWKSHAGLNSPPAHAIALWQRDGCGVWISDEWGPAVPYHPVEHGDGTQNHGYVRLKENPGGAGRIPEVRGWPELQRFLEALNAPESPVESVGCEKGYFAGGEGTPSVKLGSYIDLVFSEPGLNDRPENLLLLASQLVRAVEDCEKWWANISFVLQRNRGLSGANMPWGLMLQIKNYGRSEEEARRLWGISLSRLSKAIESLPCDLRYSG